MHVSARAQTSLSVRGKPFADRLFFAAGNNARIVPERRARNAGFREGAGAKASLAGLTRGAGILLESHWGCVDKDRCVT